MLYANTVLLDTVDFRPVYLVCGVLEPSPDGYQITTGMYLALCLQSLPIT